MNYNIPNTINEPYKEGTKNTWNSEIIWTPKVSSVVLPNEIKSGRSVPNYRHLIAAGQDASSAYSRQGSVVRTRKSTSLMCVQPFTNGTNQKYALENFRSLPAIGNALNWNDSTLRDQALAKLMRKLHQDRGDFNIVTPIAELRDLRSLISQSWSLMRTFSSLFINHRHTFRRYGKKGFESFMADSWLAFNFGFAPMYRDVVDLCQAIENFKHKKHKTSFRAKASKDGLYSFNRTSPLKSTSVGKLYTTDHCRRTLTYRFKCGYDYGIIQSANDYTIMDHLGLTPGGIIAGIYAAIPWSWLLDYVTTTGSFIQDTFLVPSKPLIYLNEVKVVKLDFTSVDNWVNDPGNSVQNPAYLASSVFEPEKVSAYSYSRIPLTKFPRRELRFKTSDEIMKHWFTKTLNLLAIASGLSAPRRR